MSSHLYKDSQILNWKNFENGLVKIQDGKESLLSDQEATAVKSFTKHVYAETEKAGADYAEQPLLAKKRTSRERPKSELYPRLKKCKIFKICS